MDKKRKVSLLGIISANLADRVDGSNPKAIPSRLPCKQPTRVGASESIMSRRPEQLPDASAKSLAPYIPIEDIAVRAAFILSVLPPIIGCAGIMWGRTGIGDADDVIVFSLSLFMTFCVPLIGLIYFIVFCRNAPEEIRGVRKWSKAFWQRNVIGRTLVMDMHGGKPRYFIDGDARLNPDLLGGAPRADVEIFDVLFSVVVNLARPRLQSRVVCSEKFLWFPRVRCVRLREGEVTLRLTDSIGNSLQFPDKTVLMALAPGISCLDIWVAHMMHDKKDLETQLDNVKRERSAYGATIRIAMEALDASHRFMRSKHAQAIRQWLRERYASLLTHDLEIIDEMPSWPRGLPKPECTPLQDKDQPRN